MSAYADIWSDPGFLVAECSSDQRVVVFAIASFAPSEVAVRYYWAVGAQRREIPRSDFETLARCISAQRAMDQEERGSLGDSLYRIQETLGTLADRLLAVLEGEQ